RPAALLRFLREPGAARRHGPQVVPRLRPSGRGVRVHPDREDPGAEPEARALRSKPRARRADLLAPPRRHDLQAAQRGRLCGAAHRVRARREARPAGSLSAMSDQIAALDATAQAELVRRREVTPKELVEGAIARL